MPGRHSSAHEDSPPPAPVCSNGPSNAALWPPLRRFIAMERALGARMARRRDTALLYEFLRFGMKQGWACLFGGLLLALLLSTHFLYPPLPLARYDFLVLAAVAAQAGLLYFRLETPTEAAVIFIYHLIGTFMEIFKISAGSWSYPEPGLLRLYGAPLFVGFMYASIGSYLFRCWRLFDFRFVHHPPLWSLAALSCGVYINFFTHHYFPDMRIALFALTGLLFWRTRIYFRPWRKVCWMPMLLGLFLVALFIWLAENIGSFSHAWLYPHQLHSWSLVGWPKLGSWFLLIVISYTLVAAVNRPQAISPVIGDKSPLSRDPLPCDLAGHVPAASAAHISPSVLEDAR